MLDFRRELAKPGNQNCLILPQEKDLSHFRMTADQAAGYELPTIVL